MKFIKGENRHQLYLFPVSIDQSVEENNEVRLIDLFVDSLDLSTFGFKSDFVENGRPAYHPADLLKLFIYGYLNRIRSSRALEKECRRNIELMWLLRRLVPDHNTIANFRKNNPKAIKKVFRSTVQLAKHFELIGGKLVAGDSTKMRAQNSKKNNFNDRKIERHIAYIDARLEEYSGILAAEDGDESSKTEAKEKIQKHQQQKEKYLQMKEQLAQSDEVQISTSDPDSRQLITRNHITEVAYNTSASLSAGIQSTVDAKYNIPIDYKVTNVNDSKAMGQMVRRAKTIIGHPNFTALYDKGYHTGTEFDYAYKQGVEVIVAFPNVSSHAPDVAFDVENFNYDKQSDEYTCPAGQKLTTNGRWYNKRNRNTVNRVKHYKTKSCLNCPLFERCTKNKSGRLIERSEHMDLIEANKLRVQDKKELYRRRQSIVEHPEVYPANSGRVIKRQWGFYYIMTKKSKKHAEADVGLIFTAFYLRRIFNIINQKELKARLNELISTFFGILAYFKPSGNPVAPDQQIKIHPPLAA